jgi:hypothetical protein
MYGITQPFFPHRFKIIPPSTQPLPQKWEDCITRRDTGHDVTHATMPVVCDAYKRRLSVLPISDISALLWNDSVMRNKPIPVAYRFTTSTHRKPGP